MKYDRVRIMKIAIIFNDGIVAVEEDRFLMHVLAVPLRAPGRRVRNDMHGELVHLLNARRYGE